MTVWWFRTRAGFGGRSEQVNQVDHIRLIIIDCSIAGVKQTCLQADLSNRDVGLKPKRPEGSGLRSASVGELTVLENIRVLASQHLPEGGWSDVLEHRCARRQAIRL